MKSNITIISTLHSALSFILGAVAYSTFFMSEQEHNIPILVISIGLIVIYFINFSIYIKLIVEWEKQFDLLNKFNRKILNLIRRRKA
jgi:hypothetical protein